MLARTHALSLRATPRAARTAPASATAHPPSAAAARRAEWIHAALRVALPWVFVTVALIAHG